MAETTQRALGRDDFNSSLGYETTLHAQADREPGLVTDVYVLDRVARQDSVSDEERTKLLNQMCELVTPEEFSAVTRSIVLADIKRKQIEVPPEVSLVEELSASAYLTYFAESNITEKEFTYLYKELIMDYAPRSAPDKQAESLEEMATVDPDSYESVAVNALSPRSNRSRAEVLASV